MLRTYVHKFVFVFVFVFFPSHLLSSPFYSLPPSRNSDPGSHTIHSRLFFPPTHCGSCHPFLSREDFVSFFPRRLASNCAYPRKALSAVNPFLLLFLKINSTSRDGGIRTHGPTQVAQHSRATTSPPVRPAIQYININITSTLYILHIMVQHIAYMSIIVSIPVALLVY